MTESGKPSSQKQVLGERVWSRKMEKDLKESVQKAWRIEAGEINKIEAYMDYEAMERAVCLLAGAKRIAASGCGHTGIACRHLAHLMCCIERPARFISPSEGNHGGLGFLEEGDVLVLASRGGRTEELLPMLLAAIRKRVHVIAVTENPDSDLGRGAEVVLPIHIERETDPFNSQGTTSFVVMSALFDALQAAVMERTGYKEEQFARNHPGGAVGEQLKRKLGFEKEENSLSVREPAFCSAKQGGTGMEVTIDFSKTCGRIKPMHGVNNVPFVPQDYGNSGLFQKMSEAGIPFSRLHDTGGDWGGAHYVDIANVFPDFDADPEDIASYDFAFTDRLMEEIVKYRMEPFYRLGCSIENLQHIRAYHIYPPEDNLKWAKICEGIIRHYNKGWGNGYHMNIRYWEIWNEPDNMPDANENPMWKGTMEQYFALYETAAGYLKHVFPEIRIGGYSSCGFYALSDADYSEVAHSSSRVGYFIEFFHRFLAYITSPEHACPLDFFSFHSYADIGDNVMYARYAREQLDRYGLKNTELIFNEWNAGVSLRGTAKDGARIASMMCALQNTPVDACMYYDAWVGSSYCGLFDPVRKTVFKAYYAFVCFNELYRLENQVCVEGAADGIYCLAAGNGEEGAFLLANLTGKEIPLQITVKGRNVGEEAEICAQLWRTDSVHEYQQSELAGCRNSFRTEVLPEAVYLFRFPKMQNRTEGSDICG